MAARNTPAPDGPPRRKSVLFCPRCDHESTLSGDWQVRTDGTAVKYGCPDCGETVLEQPRPLAP